MAALLVLLLTALVLGISWIATCGVIYLITLCFGWGFNWLIATGIWLVIVFILKPIFKQNK